MKLVAAIACWAASAFCLARAYWRLGPGRRRKMRAVMALRRELGAEGTARVIQSAMGWAAAYGLDAMDDFPRLMYVAADLAAEGLDAEAIDAELADTAELWRLLGDEQQGTEARRCGVKAT